MHFPTLVSSFAEPPLHQLARYHSYSSHILSFAKINGSSSSQSSIDLLIKFTTSAFPTDAVDRFPSSKNIPKHTLIIFYFPFRQGLSVTLLSKQYFISIRKGCPKRANLPPYPSTASCHTPRSLPRPTWRLIRSLLLLHSINPPVLHRLPVNATLRLLGPRRRTNYS